MSQQKTVSRKGSPTVNMEHERQYLQRANDQLRRCQIALFRYQKNVKKGQGGLNMPITLVATVQPNSKSTTSRNMSNRRGMRT